MIQGIWRQRQARRVKEQARVLEQRRVRAANTIKAAWLQKRKHAAATSLQKLWRGFLVKRKYNKARRAAKMAQKKLLLLVVSERSNLG